MVIRALCSAIVKAGHPTRNHQRTPWTRELEHSDVDDYTPVSFARNGESRRTLCEDRVGCSDRQHQIAESILLARHNYQGRVQRLEYSFLEWCWSAVLLAASGYDLRGTNARPEHNLCFSSVPISTLLILVT